MTITLFSTIPPASIAPFTQTATWRYKLVTSPVGAFDGKVECPTKISTESFGVIEATGIIAVEGVGASTSDVAFEDKISVSGLNVGDGIAVRSVSVAAPRNVLVPINGATLDGITTW